MPLLLANSTADESTFIVPFVAHLARARAETPHTPFSVFTRPPRPPKAQRKTRITREAEQTGAGNEAFELAVQRWTGRRSCSHCARVGVRGSHSDRRRRGRRGRAARYPRRNRTALRGARRLLRRRLDV